ncbi:tetratricopeptide repeat protein [Hymenobacter sp. M29]|uniref:Tetratricopeptide repeat protein n=1 Tax=Hymenobacter mellowenesis TaxID=3063995 RepID=A0ABT9AFD7_9BACT|nr:tetratricopeptide repeat protein [Hymenobacter sp. M29]MDO7848268.1 tetratricopeptide repeat protein [Hymenobacter sp. M29]
MASPTPPRRRANLGPISTGIDTVSTVDAPAYLSFSAEQWRSSVQICLRCEGELLALRMSKLFEKERPGDFDAGDRAFQAALRENVDKLQLSIDKYTALLARPNPDLSAYNNRGYALLVLGKYKEAIPDFNQAIALRAVEAYAYNNRGFAYLRSGRASKALADIQHSLQLDPVNSYAHRNLGIYFYEQGQYEPALAALERAQALNAQTPHLQRYLQLAKHSLDQSSQ